MQMQRSNSEADMATRFPTIFRKSLTLFAVAAALGGGALVAAPAKTNWLLNFSTTAKGSHMIGNPAARASHNDPVPATPAAIARISKPTMCRKSRTSLSRPAKSASKSATWCATRWI